LNSCSNRSKKKCKIFADDTFILWKDASGRRITLQEASKGNSSRINYESKNRVTYICRRSLDVVFVRWDPDPSLAAYIQTAKERGLTPQRCAKLLGRDLIKDVSPTEEIVNTKNGLSKNLQERLKSLEDHGFITKDEAAVKRKAILEGL
jgi:hypothetical protein